MKGYKYEFDGTEYTLCFTGEVFFDIDNIVGDKEIAEAIKPETKEGFQKLCKTAALLSEQGELVRRYLGYEPAETLDEDELRKSISPSEMVDLYNAVLEAIILGCKREIGDKTKEVSLTRQKMLKKKELD